MKKYTVLLVALIYLFSGCSSKVEEEYNKPAIYWYNKMITHISNFAIDKADDVFTSLESEHKKSALIPTAMLILANAHIDNDEYEMAIYYLDEYETRFGHSKDIDYIRFLKIKTKFSSLQREFRDQQSIIDLSAEVNVFISSFPNSEYKYLANTIQNRLLMTKASFDKEISELYARIDKPKASLLYKHKAKQNWYEISEIEEIDIPWYRAIFE
jgi:outer membrane protein assembly factor BamD